jgi:hypothetical protein
LINFQPKRTKIDQGPPAREKQKKRSAHSHFLGRMTSAMSPAERREWITARRQSVSKKNAKAIGSTINRLAIFNPTTPLSKMSVIPKQMIKIVNHFPGTVFVGEEDVVGIPPDDLTIESFDKYERREVETSIGKIPVLATRPRDLTLPDQDPRVMRIVPIWVTKMAGFAHRSDLLTLPENLLWFVSGSDSYAEAAYLFLHAGVPFCEEPSPLHASDEPSAKRNKNSE